MSESDSRTRSGAPSVEAAAAGTAATGEPGPDGAALGAGGSSAASPGIARSGRRPVGGGGIDPVARVDTGVDTGDELADDPDDDDPDGAELDGGGRPGRAGAGRRRSRLWWTPLVLVVVAGLLAAGAALGDLLDRPPGEGSVDVGFARDMSEHHAQAVQMAMIEFDHGADTDTRNVAQDIALTQQREVGVMSSWLSGWGRAQTATGPPMLWMDDPAVTGSADGHDHGMAGMDMSSGASGTADPADTARMPGMATPAELQRLASSRGHDLDVLFLTLMVRHHRGGVEMAQYAALHAGDDKVRTLARATVVAQSVEIDQMQRDLVRLGASRA